MGETDVPSPIDFHDLPQARKWEEQTIAARPWRPQFFAAIAAALNSDFLRPIRVLELGSGPGHLAEQLLTHCNISHYAALDFSPAMHAIARERLKKFADRVDFCIRDFRQSDWNVGLGPIDAIVTMQAAHETRHKRHLLSLLVQTRQLLSPGGLLLFCDHYSGEGKHPDLYFDADAQPEILRAAGFPDVTRLLDLGGMALYLARPA